MGEVRNRNILIGIVDNDPYALKVFGTLIERMSSDFAVIWTCDLGARGHQPMPEPHQAA